MKVIYGNDLDNSIPKDAACALGFFDGVHIGHQKLIRCLKEYSNSHNIGSMVFTFDRHPLTVLDSARAPKLIYDNESKTRVFAELGVDILYFSHVDRDFLRMSPYDFLDKVLMEHMNVRAIVAGFNFSFGNGASGNAQFLRDFSKKSGVEVRIVEPVHLDGTVVSSSEIRASLAEGNIGIVNRMLGRPYAIHGEVIQGMQRGRKLGFPTINLSTAEGMMTPKDGVYITYVNFNGLRKIGITNVGSNPTFNGRAKTVETYILDYSGDLYGADVSLEFCKRIRDEVKFATSKELTAQMDSDLRFAEVFLDKN